MKSTAQMDASWLERLKGELDQPYMKKLEAFLAEEYRSGKTVYPPFNQIFNALCQTPFQNTKVIIIGQDPYHGRGQAHGLSFSVPVGVDPPPSLKNIFKEISDDLGSPTPTSGCLLSWAKQGVCLLNATLTVRENEPKSHYGKGWEEFTDKIVQLLATKQEGVAFVLWGKSAQEKWQHLSTAKAESRHLVLTAPHPSPLSAHTGFLGCRHFSKINNFLKQTGQTPINWFF